MKFRDRAAPRFGLSYRPLFAPTGKVMQSQLTLGLLRVPCQEQFEHCCFLCRWKLGDPGVQFRIALAIGFCGLLVGQSGCCQQILIDFKKFRQRVLRSGQSGKSERRRGLGGLFVNFAGAHAG
ncbi:MAG: hypothetical protein AABZ67_16010, partial [Pseudomonadota bacterium]